VKIWSWRPTVAHEAGKFLSKISKKNWGNGGASTFSSVSFYGGPMSRKKGTKKKKTVFKVYFPWSAEKKRESKRWQGDRKKVNYPLRTGKGKKRACQKTSRRANIGGGGGRKKSKKKKKSGSKYRGGIGP